MIAELEQALRERFPYQGIMVQELVGGTRLGACFEVATRRYIVITPRCVDYHSHDLPWWLYKFSEEIQKKATLQ